MPPAPVKIERIAGDRTRQNTFHKRKLGLIKKAIELTVLCDCDIAIIMKSGPTIMCPEGKMSAYCNKDLDAMIAQYMTEPPTETYSNAEYGRLTKGDTTIPENVGALSPLPLAQQTSAVHEILDSTGMNSRKSSISDEEEAEELKQRLVTMEEELNRLRTKVNSGNRIVDMTELAGSKRSPPPLECKTISEVREPDAKRHCKDDSPRSELCIAYSFEGEHSNFGNLVESLEQSDVHVVPDALCLKAEISGSVAPPMLTLEREVSWGHLKVGREASGDLSCFFSSTPTNGVVSPCNLLATPSGMLAGCPLLRA